MQYDDSVYSSAILMAGQAFHLPTITEHITLGDSLLHCNQAKAMGRECIPTHKICF